MVYFMENPMNKWMIWGFPPIFGKHPYPLPSYSFPIVKVKPFGHRQLESGHIGSWGSWGPKISSPKHQFSGTKMLHPGRLTWNLKITYLKRKIIFQTPMIMFHVNLQGCSVLPSLKLTYSSPLKMDGWNTMNFPFGARPIFRCVCC